VKALLKFAAGTVLVYCLYCGLLFLLQRQMIFPRAMIPKPPAMDIEALGIEPQWVQTSFGRVETWYLPPAGASATKRSPAVIFGHGNGELIDFQPVELNRFSQLGMGLLLVEYPGYGRSAGAPSRKSISETFTKAYDLLASRGDVDASRIIFFGRSLGGGAVCDLLQVRPAAALVIMSSFKSVRSFAARYLAPPFLIRDPFDNLAAVRQFAGPVLVIHGRFDEVIPLEHGLALHAAAQDGTLIVYPAGHNDCPPDWDVFWRDIETFLRKEEVIYD